MNDNGSPEKASTNTKPTTPNAAVRLHYLTGRLLLRQNDPTNALPHLQLAAEKTKKWPSLHLTIQRVLLDCERKCNSPRDGSDASIKLLLEPSACSLLSENEVVQAQQHAVLSESREVIWRDDDAGVARPPLDFAVTFLDSTHAASGDTVLACVSVKSCVDISLYVDSIQLETTAGSFAMANLQQHVNKETLQSWIKNGSVAKVAGGYAANVGSGIQLNAKGLVYCFTEMKLPPSLVETAWGRTAADLSKFHPKNGKLCNMGFTVAGKLVCWKYFNYLSIYVPTLNIRSYLCG